jgi:tetratricopeptide (TPR) repeat protein
VNRAEGLFGPAARDLEAAVEFDPGLSSAWNVLGLVRIALREFDGAEEALERARAVEARIMEETGARPGGEYLAILYNLASFHEGLASFYSREYRMTPTVEGQQLMERHSAGARKYFEEFLKYEPAASPDAEEVRTKMAALP